MPATLLATASSCIVVAISDGLDHETGSSLLATNRLTMNRLCRLPKCVDFLVVEGIKCLPKFGLEEEGPEEAISVAIWLVFPFH